MEVFDLADDEQDADASVDVEFPDEGPVSGRVPPSLTDDDSPRLS